MILLQNRGILNSVHFFIIAIGLISGGGCSIYPSQCRLVHLLTMPRLGHVTRTCMSRRPANVTDLCHLDVTAHWWLMAIGFRALWLTSDELIWTAINIGVRACRGCRCTAQGDEKIFVGIFCGNGGWGEFGELHPRRWDKRVVGGIWSIWLCKRGWWQGRSLGLERLEAVSRRFLERLGLVSVLRVWKNRTSRSWRYNVSVSGFRDFRSCEHPFSVSGLLIYQ